MEKVGPSGLPTLTPFEYRYCYYGQQRDFSYVGL